MSGAAEVTAGAAGRRKIAAMIALAALYVAALELRFADLMVDDAYIGFVFLRNLLEGHGFVFYPGGPAVEGVTNLGWILALAPAAAAIGPVAAAKLLGGILLFASLILAGAMGLRLARAMPELPQADSLMLAVPILLAASFEFVYFPLAGMETGALALTVLLMAWAAQGAPNPLLLPALGALGFTFHPEAVLIYPLFLALRGWAAWRPALRGILAYAALLAAITAGRLIAFSAWLPNTFASKPPAKFETIGNSIVEMIAGGHAGIGFPIAGLFGLGLLLLGWSRLRRDAPNAAAILAACAGTGLVFAVYARPDWTLSPRYFAPYLPAALMLLWTGALELSARLWPRRILPLIALGSIALALSAVLLGARLGGLDKFPGYVLASRTLLGPAKAIAATLPPDGMIATRRIGALAYVTRRPVFDYVYGLTDPDVARAVARRGGAFEQPSAAELAPIWKARAPGWIIEDAPVLKDIAEKAGGNLQGFTLHGMRYREARRFRIAPGVDWLLAERVDPPIQPD